MSRVAASYEQLTQENVFGSWVFISRSDCFILWVEVELLWVEVDLSKSILASLALMVFSVYGIFLQILHSSFKHIYTEASYQ